MQITCYWDNQFEIILVFIICGSSEKAEEKGVKKHKHGHPTTTLFLPKLCVPRTHKIALNSIIYKIHS